MEVPLPNLEEISILPSPILPDTQALQMLQAPIPPENKKESDKLSGVDKMLDVLGVLAKKI